MNRPPIRNYRSRRRNLTGLRSPYLAPAGESLISGSVASVLRYNTFSRTDVALCVKLFGIPDVAYFGDFGFVIFANLMGKALETSVGFVVFYGFSYRLGNVS